MVDDSVDEAPASPAESLRVIQAQTSATVRSLRPDPRLLYWPWGLAWFIGFGLLFLRQGPHDEVRVRMPYFLPLFVLFALMIVAWVISGVTGARAYRQVQGDSSWRGLVYGMTWFAGFASVGVIASRIGDLLPPPEQGLLWAALSMALVGALYMAGAALWKAREMLVLGVWLTLANIAGVIAGPGWHSLVISVAGGGGMLVVGFIEARRFRRAA